MQRLYEAEAAVASQSAEHSKRDGDHMARLEGRLAEALAQADAAGQQQEAMQQQLHEAQVTFPAPSSILVPTLHHCHCHCFTVIVTVMVIVVAIFMVMAIVLAIAITHVSSGMSMVSVAWALSGQHLLQQLPCQGKLQARCCFSSITPIRNRQLRHLMMEKAAGAR